MARRSTGGVGRIDLRDLRGGINESGTGWRRAIDVVQGADGTLAWRGAKKAHDDNQASTGTLWYQPNLLRSDMCDLVAGSGVFYTAAWPPVYVDTRDSQNYAAGVVYAPTGWYGDAAGFTRSVSFGDELISCPFISTALYTGHRFAGNAAGQTLVGYGTPAATLTTTLGSTTITASSGTFSAAWVGRYIRVRSGSLLPRRWYKIMEVTSSTVAIVDVPASDSVAGAAFDYQHCAPWLTTPGTFGVGGYGASGTGLCYTPANNGDNAVAASVACVHEGRVIVANVIDLATGTPRIHPERIRWSGSAADGASAAYPEFTGHERFELGAYQDIFPGEGGGSITALASFGGVLYVFKPHATYAVLGAMHVDGIDVGLSVVKVSPTHGAAGPGNIVVTPHGVVVADSGRVILYQSPYGPPSNLAGPVQRMFVQFDKDAYYPLVSYTSATDRLVLLLNPGDVSGTYRLNVRVFTYHFEGREWYEQQSSSDVADYYNPIFSNVVTIPGLTASVADIELSGASHGYAPNYRAWCDWMYDLSEPLGLSPQTPINDAFAPRPLLESSPIDVSMGGRGGRVRAVMFNGSVPSGSGPVSAGVATGAISDLDSPATSIGAASIATGAYDYVRRVALRSGTQPLRYARVLIEADAANSGGFGSGGVVGLGVEVVRVDRLR